MKKNKLLLIYAWALIVIALMQYGFQYFIFLPEVLEVFQEEPEVSKILENGFVKVYVGFSIWPISFIAYLFTAYFKSKDSIN